MAVTKPSHNLTQATQYAIGKHTKSVCTLEIFLSQFSQATCETEQEVDSNDDFAKLSVKLSLF